MFVCIAADITSGGLQMQGVLPSCLLGGTGGRHLSVKEFHQAVLGCQQQNDSVIASGSNSVRKQVLIDTRNHYETTVGTSKGAIDPKVPELIFRYANS